MTAGHWLVMVDKETGSASTEFVSDADEAWQRSIDLEKANPRIFTAVSTRAKRPKHISGGGGVRR